MHALYDTTVFVHAAAGAICLATVAIPLAARKGGKLHRRSGWVFVSAMAISALTALLIAAAWIGSPLTFKSPPQELDTAALARWVELHRVFGCFFGFIGFIAGVATWQGVMATRYKTELGPWGGRLDRSLAALIIVLGAALATVGIWHGQALLIGFGILGVVSGRSDLKTYSVKPPPRGAWLFRHFGAMLGAATVAFTAFSVQVVGRQFAGGGLFGLGMVVWVVPVAAGMLTTTFWSRKLRRSQGQSSGL